MDYANQAKPLNTKDMPTTGRRGREATLPAGEGADYCEGTHPPAFAYPRCEEFHAEIGASRVLDGACAAFDEVEYPWRTVAQHAKSLKKMAPSHRANTPHPDGWSNRE